MENENRFYYGLYLPAQSLLMLVAAFSLTACSSAPLFERTPIERPDFTQNIAASHAVTTGLPLEDFQKQNGKKPIKLGLSESEAKSLGCNIKDRFDNSAALSYRFSEGHSQVALHLGMEGPSFSNPTRLKFTGVMLRYTHHFSNPKKTEITKKEKCRFPSRVQGLIGSVYNELFLRDNYTVREELRRKLKLSQ